MKIKMNDKNIFYGKNAERMSRGYGIALLFITAIDYIFEYEQQLTITIKGKTINLFFVLICVLMCIFLRFFIKGLRNRKKQNYIKLFDDYMEINSRQRDPLDVLSNNVKCTNSVIYYKDIDHIELNSLGLKRQIGLFRVTGLRNYWNYMDSFKDVFVTKKDGSVVVFPEITNREYFGIELRSKGVKIIISNSKLSKTSILVDKNRS